MTPAECVAREPLDVLPTALQQRPYSFAERRAPSIGWLTEFLCHQFILCELAVEGVHIPPLQKRSDAPPSAIETELWTACSFCQPDDLFRRSEAVLRRLP